MEALTTKTDVKVQLEKCISGYQSSGVSHCVAIIHERILCKKVRFPLLEYCARELHQVLSYADQLKFCDRIEALQTIGGNVIIGIFLQERLSTHFESSLDQAAEYISRADAWYVCDIIGERVFGHALLYHTDKALPLMKHMAQHSSPWVVRSLGAGFHNAIKWGLEAQYVKQLFRLLLTLANNTNKEIKQGVGWAAKTTAKFHPKIIAYFQEQIQDKQTTGNWFRTKVRIGLERNSALNPKPRKLKRH